MACPASMKGWAMEPPHMKKRSGGLPDAMDVLSTSG